MSNAAKLKKKAAEFEQKKQFDKALAHYLQLLEELGSDIEDIDVPLYNRVGDLLMRQGTTSEALLYYEKAVDVYAERGFLNNAIALCNKILRQSPARTTVYYKLGKISASKGFKSDAKKNFLEYADRMQKAGQLDEAFRALKEFADLCPDQDDIRLMLAEHLSKENRKDEALEQLQTLYVKFETEGRGAEARATIDRMRAIDPHVTPRPSGSYQTIKSNDLVFLDLTDQGRRVTSDVSVVEEPAPVTTPRSQPNVPALDGLTLTFHPEDDDQIDAAPALVEGFAPTIAEESTDSEVPADPLEIVQSEAFTPSDVPVQSLLVPDESAGEDILPDEGDVAPLAGLIDGLDRDAAPSEGEGEEDLHGGLDGPLSGSEFAALELASVTDEYPHAAPHHDLALPSALPMLGDDQPGVHLSSTSDDGDEQDLSSPTTSQDEIEIDLLEQMLSPMARSAPAPEGSDLLDLMEEDMREMATAGLELIDLGGTPALGSPALPLIDIEGSFDDSDIPTSDVLERGDAVDDVEVPAGQFALGEPAGEAPVSTDADSEESLDSGGAPADDSAGLADGTEREEIPEAAPPVDDDSDERLHAVTPISPIRAYVPSGASVPQVSDEELASVREDGESELQPMPDERPTRALSGTPIDLPLISTQAPAEQPGAESAVPVDESAAEDAPIEVATTADDDVVADPHDGREAGNHDFLTAPASFGDVAGDEPTDFQPHPPLSLDTLEPESSSPPAAHLPIDRLDELRARVVAEPGDWALHRELGEALLDRGDREAGLEELDVALTGLEVQADLAAADAIAEELVRLVPASVRHHQKRVEYAVRSGDRVRLVDAYLELADALFRSGEADKSYVVYSRVSELAPNNDRARIALGSLVPPPPAGPDTPPLGIEELLLDTISTDDAASAIAAEPSGAASTSVAAIGTVAPHDETAASASLTPSSAADALLDEEIAAALADDGAADAGDAFDADGDRGALERGPAQSQKGEPRFASTPYSPSRETPSTPSDLLATVGSGVPDFEASHSGSGGTASRGDSDFVDLGDWLREDERPKSTRMVTADPAPSGDEQADFDEMLRKFKQGVAENVDDEDYESHYDLGVAYKEMGLIDEAISEFQKSLRGQANRVRSYEALGQCFVEKSQYQVANALLGRAVESADVDDQRLVGVLYLLAYACEATGHWSDALRYYQRVFAVDVAFRDVAQRVPAMERKTQ